MAPVCLLLLAALMFSAEADLQNYLMTFPQSPIIEVGTNFTATCVIINTDEVTSDELEWRLSETTLPRELYTKVNSSALSVTFTVTSDQQEWLFCRCNKRSPMVILNQGRFIHAIYLHKGYGVQSPVNLTCKALQDKDSISGIFTCEWNDPGPHTADAPVTYTLYVKDITDKVVHSTTNEPHAKVDLGTFPDHTPLEVWVKSENKLGSTESEHLREDSGKFVKTNPPYNIALVSEASFPTSLLLTWTWPIHVNHLHLMYQIRYCAEGAHTWTDILEEDLSQDIQSFRLQGLQPYKVYLSQVRCKNARHGHGFWSEWSTNATTRTPEGLPGSKPDLWRIISDYADTKQREIEFITKEPLLPNGRILRYDVKVFDHKAKNASRYMSFNTSDTDGRTANTTLNKVLLPENRTIRVIVSAVNSVGKSPDASLGLTDRLKEFPQVDNLRAWPHEGRLMVEWRPPNTSKVVTEFVVEWENDGKVDWQRETNNTSQTTIRGHLQPFVCYRVSVFAIFSGWSNRGAVTQAYLQQDVPSMAPDINPPDLPVYKKVKLSWAEVPVKERNGFINYTLFYQTGSRIEEVPLPPGTTNYTLYPLLPATSYHAWIKVSTTAGSRSGPTLFFTTSKYAPGEIEGIVVGVSLGLLFVFLMTVLLCFYKRDLVKENFWPQIPDPGESTIGNWAPDYPKKVEPPRESGVSGISVLDVDACDGRSLFDEEKAGLSLKKDKFLSEEHSSGIGGSSCMSSPRQSVSDSDEGGDMADTTASTVQYSSVVASNGYKGQTPAQAPPTVFLRSESTQPLLDSEENPDTTSQDGSRQSQRFGRPMGTEVTHRLQGEELLPLDFCPLQEDSENNTPADDQSDTLPSSYMPQLGGYRPQ